MKLKNLIDVADRNVTFMLTGIQNDGNEIGYNFVTHSWMDNNLFTPERIQTIGAFKDTKFFRRLKDNKIETFSVFRAASVESLRNSDVHFHEGKVLKISIFLSNSDSEIKKAMDAKIDKIIANKQLPSHKPKKQTYRRKKNWSYVKKTPVIEGESQKKNHEEVNNELS